MPWDVFPRPLQAIRAKPTPCPPSTISPIPSAASMAGIHLIDGTLVSWYGPRIAKAIRLLRPLLSQGRTRGSR